jgi:hypothetical protein
MPWRWSSGQAAVSPVLAPTCVAAAFHRARPPPLARRLPALCIVDAPSTVLYDASAARETAVDTLDSAVMCAVYASGSLQTYELRHVPLLTTSLHHPDALGEHMRTYPTVRDRHKHPVSRTSALASCALAQNMYARGEAQPLRDQPSMTLLLWMVYLRCFPHPTWHSKTANQNHKACLLAACSFCIFCINALLLQLVSHCMSHRGWTPHTIARPSHAYTPISSHAHHHLAPPLRIRPLPTSFPGSYSSHVLDNPYPQAHAASSTSSPSPFFRRWIICGRARSSP